MHLPAELLLQIIINMKMTNLKHNTIMLKLCNLFKGKLKN